VNLVCGEGDHHKSWRGQKSEQISSKDPSQIRPKRSLKNKEILLKQEKRILFVLFYMKDFF